MTGSARTAAPVASGPERGASASLALALLLSCAFAFTGLSNHPLRAADEPRVAGIAWEMAHTGNVLVPHLGGEPFVEHPPLYYATLAATIRLFGSSEATARLPGALAAAATLLLTFDLARRTAGRTAGLMAICVLASTPVFFRLSHKVMADAWLTAAVMLGYWAYARAACEGAPDEEPSPRFVLLLYGAGALAFLAKGPVGLILLGGAVGLHALLARRWRFLRSKAHVAGLLLLSAGCAAWPAALYAFADREVFDEFFWQNVVYRVFPIAGAYTGGHEEPLWYYLRSLPAIVGVWVAALPALGAWVLGGALPVGWNARMIRFAASVFPVALLLLSLPATKRWVYLLPAVPPLAAALGAWIASTGLTQGASRIERGTLRAGAAAMTLVAVAARALVAPAEVLARHGGVGARAKRLRSASVELLHRARLEAAGAAPVRAVRQLAWLAFAGALFSNVALRAVDPGRDFGPLAREIVLAGAGRPLAAYWLDEQMRGALPFYSGVIVRNLHTPGEVRSFLRENPGALLLQGDYPLRSFPADFPELRRIRSWPTAEGVYNVYALAPSETYSHDEVARAGPMP